MKTMNNRLYRFLAFFIAIAIIVPCLGSNLNASSDEYYEDFDISEYCYQSDAYSTDASPVSSMTAKSANEVVSYIAGQLRAGNLQVNIVDYQVLETDLLAICTDVFNSNPDLYYIKTSFSYTRRSSSGIIVSIYFTRGVSEAKCASVDSVVNSVIALTNSSMSDVAKALVVHDYIVLNTCYAYDEYLSGTLDSVPNVRDAYGALVNGKAVCQGYAEAYALIMTRLGIECRVIASDSMNHAWNIIKIGNYWYHVDCTWDDPVYNVQGRCNHDHFLKSDAEMQNNLDHSGWSSPVTCVSTIFDDAWWDEISSQIVIVDGKYYYTGRSSRTGYIYEKSGGIERVYASFQTPRVPSGSSYYLYNSSLSFVGGNFYYFDESHIYQIDRSTKATRTVYSSSSYMTEVNVNIKGIAYIHTDGMGKGKYTTVNIASQVAATPTPTKAATAETNAFAERLYSCALNRASDPTGLNYWSVKLANGFSGAQAAKEFLFSTEVVNANISDEEFINRLYRTFLNREGDSVGVSFWINKLHSGSSREAVFNGFVDSQEWANICYSLGINSGSNVQPQRDQVPRSAAVSFVNRLYSTCLGREGDATGINYWALKLSNKTSSGSDVARLFFFSDEFISLNTSDSEYISRLYRTFLNREGSEAEIEYWRVVLINTPENSARETVFRGFVNSDEFKELCVAADIIPGV